MDRSTRTFTRRSWRRVATVIAMLGLAVGACGSDSEPAAQPTTTTEATDIGADPDPTTTTGQASNDPAATDPPADDPGCETYTDFTTATSQNWPMRRCQKGPLVQEVQQALADLGYEIEADGFFGQATEAAVEDWRGDGVGELIPADVEALIPFDE